MRARKKKMILYSELTAYRMKFVQKTVWYFNKRSQFTKSKRRHGRISIILIVANNSQNDIYLMSGPSKVQFMPL